eukprot:gnl/MRDRNA2_/MRDRNA2_128845_c0_seq1.p1 gnl/MRDRNA2_/MRDRNA2_128845_c0~~gnl/MRDRNA2_/MRDRNA2_128845_c0_seq1.p1  ORF type:complete len:239 (+),score=41.85 gnl/MRDRNA2_/MRDRNA2_128845_c0_seq1:3-719(+)
MISITFFISLLVTTPLSASGKRMAHDTPQHPASVAADATEDTPPVTNAARGDSPHFITEGGTLESSGELASSTLQLAPSKVNTSLEAVAVEATSGHLAEFCNYLNARVAHVSMVNGWWTSDEGWWMGVECMSIVPGRVPGFRAKNKYVFTVKVFLPGEDKVSLVFVTEEGRYDSWIPLGTPTDADGKPVLAFPEADKMKWNLHWSRYHLALGDKPRYGLQLQFEKPNAGAQCIEFHVQ